MTPDPTRPRLILPPAVPGLLMTLVDGTDRYEFAGTPSTGRSVLDKAIWLAAIARFQETQRGVFH